MNASGSIKHYHGMKLDLVCVVDCRWATSNTRWYLSIDYISYTNYKLKH